MDALLRTLRTARYLRPVQIAGRLSMRMRRGLLLRSDFVRDRNRPAPGAASRVNVLPVPPFEGVPQEGIEKGEFTFLNQSVALARPVDWQPEGVDQLWRYQLHAFEYLLPLARRWRTEGSGADGQLLRELVGSWIESVPMGVAPAWDSYPTSLRIRAWIYAYSLIRDRLAPHDDFARKWLESLHSQARFLERFLERHLLGNHLVENARSLLLAGLFFSDRNAARWRAEGERMLWRELDRQFLADGGHEELSPMYHQIMLELYREVVAVLTAMGRPVPARVLERIADMQRWLAAMVHPDGKLALLSDAAFGMAGSTGPLVAGIEPVAGLQAMPESGYFVFREGAPGDFGVFDCGPIGPDHQPGHGHCDCLSYELDFAGERILIDSGVGTYYGDLAWRDYYRSTGAHNTLRIDGAEQSEIWDRFRVGRRHRILGVRWGEEPGLAWASGAHDGYRYLPDPVVHRRWICRVDRRFWLICDRVAGRGRHRVESFMHFHPEAKPTVAPTLDGRHPGSVQRGEVSVQILSWGAQSLREARGELSTLQGWCAEEFNRHRANTTWSFEAEGETPLWMASVLWSGPERAKARFAARGGESLEIAIDSGTAVRRIVCSDDGVELIGE